MVTMISFISFISAGNKNYAHEIKMSHRNGRNSRKCFAKGDEDFLDFFYFFDERSGKADDRGTIKHYPHEIIMSHRNGRKGFASGG